MEAEQVCIFDIQPSDFFCFFYSVVPYVYSYGQL